MAFEKLVSFTKDVSDLSDQPAMTAAELKAQFDSAPDEVRQYLNKLIDALKSIAMGDSGAKNIGVTNINGLTGFDVQTLLESLKTYVDGLSYLPAGVGKTAAGQSATLNLATGASQDFTITYPTGRFSSTPSLTYSVLNGDTDAAYNLASSITTNSSTGATIRLKNKSSSAYQYVIIYWQAQEQK